MSESTMQVFSTLITRVFSRVRFCNPTPWRSQFVNCKLYPCDMDLPASVSMMQIL